MPADHDPTNGATVGHIQALVEATQLQTAAQHEQTQESRALREQLGKLCEAQGEQRSTCAEHITITRSVKEQMVTSEVTLREQHQELSNQAVTGNAEVAGAINSLHLSVKELSEASVKQTSAITGMLTKLGADRKWAWAVAGIGVVMLGLAVVKFFGG